MSGPPKSDGFTRSCGIYRADINPGDTSTPSQSGFFSGAAQAQRLRFHDAVRQRPSSFSVMELVPRVLRGRLTPMDRAAFKRTLSKIGL